MHEDVMKPLMHEVKIKEELHVRLEDAMKETNKHFKMMYAVIRLPLMVDQFMKALKRKESAVLFKKHE